MAKKAEDYTEEIEINPVEEQERIKALLSFYGVKQEKIKLLSPIIENVVWMRFKLDDTREKIKTSSVVIPYDNGGGQTGLRENPLYKGYESLFKSYMAGMGKILECLPKEAADDAVTVEKPKSVLELVRDKHKKEA